MDHSSTAFRKTGDLQELTLPYHCDVTPQTMVALVNGKGNLLQLPSPSKLTTFVCGVGYNESNMIKVLQYPDGFGSTS